MLKKVKIVTVIQNHLPTAQKECYLPIYQVLHKLAQKVLKFQLRYG
jgi:predicted glycosyl hydrolase (DUF1957 family)